MEREEIKRKVIECIRAVSCYDLEGISEESQLDGPDIAFDTLDTFEFLVEVENEFDVEISNSQADGCTTVGDVIDLVESLL